MIISSSCSFCALDFVPDHDMIITHQNIETKTKKKRNLDRRHSSHLSCLIARVDKHKPEQICPSPGCKRIIIKDDIERWEHETRLMTKRGIEKSVSHMAWFIAPTLVGRVVLEKMFAFSFPELITTTIEISLGVTTVALLSASRGDLGQDTGQCALLVGIIGGVTTSVGILAGEIHSTAVGMLTGLGAGSAMLVSAKSFRSSGIRFRALAPFALLLSIWMINMVITTRLIKIPGGVLGAVLTAGMGGALIGKRLAKT